MKKKPRKAILRRSGMTRSPNLRRVMACGWSMRKTSCQAWRARSIALTTFMPPPVDPAHGPMAMRRSRTPCGRDPHPFQAPVAKRARGEQRPRVLRAAAWGPRARANGHEEEQDALREGPPTLPVSRDEARARAAARAPEEAGEEAGAPGAPDRAEERATAS